ncbi:MAG TPA: hypothetical protein VIW45_19620 [Vicinamibacterales bacterium]|jgi:hypothetical protein
MFARLSRLSALLLFASAATAYATTTVFGPADYTLASGAPQTINASFAANLSDTCGGRAAYFLVVSNADGNVSSASLSLNGRTLMTPHDFPLKGGVREIAVDVAASNALTIDLTGGKTGAVLRVAVERRIEATVAGPKSIVIAHPPTSDTTSFNVADASGSYILVLHSTGSASANVSLNGATVVVPSDFGSSTTSLTRRVAVAPGANQISVSLTGAPGDSLDWTLLQQLDESFCGPRIAIDTPADGDTITTRGILVTGTASGSRDLGVTVNGIVAQFNLSAAATVADPYRWFATIDPPVGDVTITAVASAPGGGSTTVTRSVHYAPASETLMLHASPDNGILPLDVTVSVSSTIKNIDKLELDLDGDGYYEIVRGTIPDPIVSSFDSTGTFTLRGRVTTTDGKVFTAATPVIVQNFKAADGAVRAAWTRFVASMAANDANGAIAQLAGDDAKANYGEALLAMAAAGRLTTYVASLQDLRAIWIHGNAAHYLLTRTESGDTFGYHVYFVRGGDGVWRVIQF